MKKEIKHVDGPWSVQKKHNIWSYEIWSDEYKQPIASVDQAWSHYCENEDGEKVTRGLSDNQIFANAKLMAAAPELKKLTEDMVNIICLIGPVTNTEKQTVDEAKELLTKISERHF